MVPAGRDSVARLLGAILLLGTTLMAASAALHPVLAGDAAAHLSTIAETRFWRELHLLMLAGTAFVATGVWARILTPLVPPALPTLIAALAIVSLGVAINGMNIAYMAGAGWMMAERFSAGDASVEALYHFTHPIGLMAARYGNLLVAMGALVLGWGERRDAATPRWLAWLAWAAAAAGFVGVLFFDEASRAVLAAVAVLSGWQVATGVRALRAPR